MTMRKALGAAVLAGSLAAAMPASATLTFNSGVGGNQGTDNLIFNACGLASNSGLTVQGCLNSNHDTLVNITGSESLHINGGQAVIDASNGTPFTSFTIAMDDPSLGFSRLIFNVDAVADGFATVTATDQFGQVFNFTNIELDGNGQNFFNLGSLDGQVAVSLTFTTNVGISNISDLTQVRLGPTALTPVPEPATLALFGAGLLGLGFVRARRGS
ncbi:PEP-CTERM sorting domain-containing protein [Muricoccus radiodurans]|uniref:PEP-CTERM sorting domain-containing protein n=1 Tax=Muricoccus radiodurans TaxID=2231721 RepID=UPI003CF85AD4